MTTDKRFLYKTAFSPLYDTFVGIKKIRTDQMGQFIFDCTIAGYPKDQVVAFRECELTRFVL
jgi:hypothetical protein